jgi:pyruvate kinase
MARSAKIVATIGPTSQDEATLTNLIKVGLNVARLNFSHGTHADHADRIKLIRYLSEKLGSPITILQDLQGPKLRVGRLPAEGVNLSAGQIVNLCQGSECSYDENNAVIIPMDVPNLMDAIEPGNRILLDDGNLEMEVIQVKSNAISAKVVLGGKLSSNKGVNLPGAKLVIPGFTEKDEDDLIFGLSQGIDAVAISFVKSASDIEIVRQAIRRYSPDYWDIPIIAKLERPEAIVNLHEIIHATDGVMVARGDLGVETSPAEVPITQKRVIQEANLHAKIVITATQMLDSMIHNPRPTRAEASDVANAIFDGTDAVMLSGETASGAYPVESVQMMDTIVCEAERHFEEWGHKDFFTSEQTRDDAVSMTRAARELAHDRNVAAIAVFTQTGRTALLMSKTRPQVPVIGLTPLPRTYQKMNLYWGVTPYLVPFANNVEEMIQTVEMALLSSAPVHNGDQVVILSGFPVGSFRLPNLALLHTIGEKNMM